MFYGQLHAVRLISDDFLSRQVACYIPGTRQALLVLPGDRQDLKDLLEAIGHARFWNDELGQIDGMFKVDVTAAPM